MSEQPIVLTVDVECWRLLATAYDKARSKTKRERIVQDALWHIDACAREAGGPEYEHVNFMLQLPGGQCALNVAVATRYRVGAA